MLKVLCYPATNALYMLLASASLVPIDISLLSQYHLDSCRKTEKERALKHLSYIRKKNPFILPQIFSTWM